MRHESVDTPAVAVCPPAAPLLAHAEPQPASHEREPPGPAPAFEASVLGGEVGGLADLDPDNDLEVAPPRARPRCRESLLESGIQYQRAALPFARKTGDTFLCGAPQVVVYQGGPEGVEYSSRPMVTCGMALALARFEEIAQGLAVEHLGSRIKKVLHLGTYNCRRARGGSRVSEHSYANAIDIQGFQLADRRTVSVGRHFRTTSSLARTDESRFLRTLAIRLYQEGTFSSVLTPHFDEQHSDHFHLDLARYRVDGAHEAAASSRAQRQESAELPARAHRP